MLSAYSAPSYSPFTRPIPSPQPGLPRLTRRTEFFITRSVYRRFFN